MLQNIPASINGYTLEEKKEFWLFTVYTSILSEFHMVGMTYQGALL